MQFMLFGHLKLFIKANSKTYYLQKTANDNNLVL